LLLLKKEREKEENDGRDKAPLMCENRLSCEKRERDERHLLFSETALVILY
jgi:hypothetical protein